jgi:hypothetical protein
MARPGKGAPKESEPIAPIDPDAPEPRPRTSQIRTEGRAATRGWATPEREKRAIVTRLIGICKPNSAEGKTVKIRSVLIAARTLISADLRQQQLELEREIAKGTGQEGTLAELVGAAEAIAAEIERQRRDTGGAGPTDQPASPVP